MITKRDDRLRGKAQWSCRHHTAGRNRPRHRPTGRRRPPSPARNRSSRVSLPIAVSNSSCAIAAGSTNTNRFHSSNWNAILGSALIHPACAVRDRTLSGTALRWPWPRRRRASDRRGASDRCGRPGPQRRLALAKGTCGRLSRSSGRRPGLVGITALVSTTTLVGRDSVPSRTPGGQKLSLKYGKTRAPCPTATDTAILNDNTSTTTWMSLVGARTARSSSPQPKRREKRRWPAKPGASEANGMPTQPVIRRCAYSSSSSAAIRSVWTKSSPLSRRVPTSADECRRVPTSADECRRVPTSADECRRVPTSADECRRVYDHAGNPCSS
ncbi:hypothetical protein CEDDRAFT_01308 [Frankia sp. CeD]|nr:hypothetical protein CEDDRAFT_01308 [Frankia sp. CeD]